MIYVILGSGGLAREVFFHLKDSVKVIDGVYFADDITTAKQLTISGKTYDVIRDWNFSTLKSPQFIIGQGDPKTKRSLVTKALAAGILPAPTIVHPSVVIQDTTATLGKGGVIAPGCILTTNIIIHDYVILNVNCTLGHDSVINDYMTCNPGLHVSGGDD